jgi:hypothetical protein
MILPNRADDKKNLVDTQSGPAISAAAMCAERSAYRADAVMVSRLARAA